MTKEKIQLRIRGKTTQINPIMKTDKASLALGWKKSRINSNEYDEAPFQLLIRSIKSKKNDGQLVTKWLRTGKFVTTLLKRTLGHFFKLQRICLQVPRETLGHPPSQDYSRVFPKPFPPKKWVVLIRLLETAGYGSKPSLTIAFPTFVGYDPKSLFVTIDP